MKTIQNGSTQNEYHGNVLTLSPEWHNVSKRWGHSFHPMCRYNGTLSARIPHYFIQKFTAPGDVVLDPFCGRGTTPLQACAEGRIGVGNDINPVAYCLTRAKVQAPLLRDVQQRLRELQSDMFYDEGDDEPRQIQMLIHPYTLGQLVYLRDRLDDNDPRDVFIKATVLGILHNAAHTQQTRFSYLALPMPDTWSTSTECIHERIEQKGLQRIRVDVFDALQRKIKRLYRDDPPTVRGKATCADVMELPDQENGRIPRRAQLVVTSPPELNPARPGFFNWIRFWFLNAGESPMNRMQTGSLKLPRYLDFISDSLQILYKMLKSGGVIALVVPDTYYRPSRKTINVAEEIWKNLRYHRSPLKLYDIVEDRKSEETRRSENAPSEKVEAGKIERALVLYKKEIEERVDTVEW